MRKRCRRAAAWIAVGLLLIVGNGSKAQVGPPDVIYRLASSQDLAVFANVITNPMFLNESVGLIDQHGSCTHFSFGAISTDRTAPWSQWSGQVLFGPSSSRGFKIQYRHFEDGTDPIVPPDEFSLYSVTRPGGPQVSSYSKDIPILVPDVEALLFLARIMNDVPAEISDPLATHDIVGFHLSYDAIEPDLIRLRLTYREPDESGGFVKTVWAYSLGSGVFSGITVD